MILFILIFAWLDYEENVLDKMLEKNLVYGTYYKSFGNLCVIGNLCITKIVTNSKYYF